MTTAAPSDLEFGAFSDHGPWSVDPALLPWRQGLDQVRLDTRAEPLARRAVPATPPGVRTARPTYIKLGQIISAGEGIFPEELVREFRLLRHGVPAEPFDAVRQVVEADLGRPLEEVFSIFEHEPLAAAPSPRCKRRRF